MAGNSAYVYVLTNPAMPGLVKIGMTTKSVKERIKELSSTGVPEPFKLYYACELRDGLDPAEVERDMHELFAPNRHNQRREFFAVDPARVRLALKYADKASAPKPMPAPKEKETTRNGLFLRLCNSARRYRRMFGSTIIRHEKEGWYWDGTNSQWGGWDDFDSHVAHEWASMIESEIPNGYKTKSIRAALLDIYRCELDKCVSDERPEPPPVVLGVEPEARNSDIRTANARFARAHKVWGWI